MGTGLCGCDQRRLGSAEAALDLLVWIHNIFSVRNLASGFEEIWKMGRYGFSVVVKKKCIYNFMVFFPLFWLIKRNQRGGQFITPPRLMLWANVF